MLGGWDTAPNNIAKYTAVLPPAEIIGEVNPTTASPDPKDPRRLLAIQSSQMNWKVAGTAPYRLLNEIIWIGVKGPHSKMPEPRVSNLTFLNRKHPGSAQGDGDED